MGLTRTQGQLLRRMMADRARRLADQGPPPEPGWTRVERALKQAAMDALMGRTGDRTVARTQEQEQEPTGLEMVLYQGDLNQTGRELTVPADAVPLLELWAGRSRVVATAVLEMITMAVESGDVQAEILEAILTATDPKAMVPDSGGVPSVRDQLDRNGDTPQFRIEKVKYNLSTMKEEGKESMPVYAVMDAVNTSTGERTLLGTGSMQTCISMWSLMTHDQLPVMVAWHQARKPTRDGWFPLNMELIASRAELEAFARKPAPVKSEVL